MDPSITNGLLFRHYLILENIKFSSPCALVADSSTRIMVNSHKFLETIILISEKAAEISRIVRSAYWKTAGNGSSSRVIETESKSDEDRTDFKTLADVLIQAVITREVHKQVKVNFSLLFFNYEMMLTGTTIFMLT